MRNLTENELASLSGGTVKCGHEKAPMIAGVMLGGVMGLYVSMFTGGGVLAKSVVGMIVGGFIGPYIHKMGHPECYANS